MVFRLGGGECGRRQRRGSLVSRDGEGAKVDACGRNWGGRGIDPLQDRNGSGKTGDGECSERPRTFEVVSAGSLGEVERDSDGMC